MVKRLIAAASLSAMTVFLVPSGQALADGAASTRNIILGIGAATYLIIQHNRKVHERYAEDARRQAQLQSENNNAWAAYSSEKAAYENERAEVADLQREVAYQHHVIATERHQQAMVERGTTFRTVRAATTNAAPKPAPVAMVAYGWGRI